MCDAGAMTIRDDAPDEARSRLHAWLRLQPGGRATARAPVGGAGLAPGQGRGRPPAAWDPAEGILIRGATVVTMDDLHTVIRDGQLLVRADRIAAVWSGPFPPADVLIGDPAIIDAGPDDLLFPGLINLHDHPSEDFLYLALPPADDAIPMQGKSGTDPHANRYQWNSPTTMPPEFARLLANPVGVLSAASGLGLETEGLGRRRIRREPGGHHRAAAGSGLGARRRPSARARRTRTRNQHLQLSQGQRGRRCRSQRAGRRVL
jgi:hypothetical protein